MKKITKNTFLLISLMLVGVVSIVGTAQAVKIIPPRLVIGPDVKTEHMFIKNNADKTEAFRFSWKNMAMDKEGNVLNLDKLGMDKAPAEYKPLDKIIRFSPRRAVLKPGQTQRITFMLRRSADLPVGEYRSHFLVQREPLSKAAAAETGEPKTNDNQPVAQEGEAPSVAFNVMVSRAVPIYVLNGKTNASLNLLNFEVKKNAKRVKDYQPEHLAHFRVQKQGNRSVIGIAHVFCTSAGKEVMISNPGKIFAVYAEGEFGNEQMAVQIPAAGCSSYRLTLKGHPDDVLAGQLLAEKSTQ